MLPVWYKSKKKSKLYRAINESTPSLRRNLFNNYYFVFSITQFRWYRSDIVKSKIEYIINPLYILLLETGHF